MLAEETRIGVAIGGVAYAPFEMVERKGRGHPDSLADAIAERASVEYARACLQELGGVPHHWFDKVMLIGGESEIAYGAGRMLKPYRVIFAGKAARRVGATEVLDEAILYNAAADVLSGVLFEFDPALHLVVEDRVSDSVGPGQRTSRYRPGSPQDLPVPGESRVANDCCICSGFAPLSPVESLVMRLDGFLQAKAPQGVVGADVKVVAMRADGLVAVEVSGPQIARKTPGWHEYLEAVVSLERDLQGIAEAESDLKVQVTLNGEREAGRPYMTVTGSVADTGDIGVVGRGNRANGLITPMRPMSIEAAAGKNPLDHSGKIYSVMANAIARQVNELLGAPAEVYIATTKERSLATPTSVAVLVSWQAKGPRGWQEAVRRVVKENLGRVGDISTGLLHGRGEQVLGETCGLALS